MKNCQCHSYSIFFYNHFFDVWHANTHRGEGVASVLKESIVKPRLLHCALKDDVNHALFCEQLLESIATYAFRWITWFKFCNLQYIFDDLACVTMHGASRNRKFFQGTNDDIGKYIRQRKRNYIGTCRANLNIRSHVAQ